MKKGLAIPLLVSATLGCGAFLVGWLFNRDEYEAFWIIFGTCCARMLLPAILPNRFAAAFYANDILLICEGFVIGFWLGRDNWWYVHTVVKWSVAIMPLFIMLGTPLAWGLNLRATRRRISGPYCRGCRYHLKGAADNRCPECGRPFTIKELGVSAAELRAHA